MSRRALDATRPHRVIAGDPRPGGLRGSPWLTLATVSCGAMMAALDSMLVAVAQPAMQADLDASFAQVQWVTTGYLLALAALLIGAGKVGDRLGHHTVFLLGIAGFTATSVALGLSREVGWVIGLRVVQGGFGALMQPATLALLRAAFPADRIMMPIAIRSGVLGASTAAGPIVGGLLVEHLSWRWAFFINLPIGLLTLALAVVVLPAVERTGERRPFDLAGLLLLSTALLAVLWAVTTAPARGFDSAWTFCWLATGVVTGALFIWRQGRAADPLMPLSLFRSVPLRVGVALMTIISFVLIGLPFLLTFYLQNVLGLSPSQCGIQVLWLTLILVVGAPINGVVMSRVGTRVPLVTGLTLTTVAVMGLRTLDAGADVNRLTGWFILLGVGFSPVVIGSTRLILSGAPLEAAGVAGGIQQTAMQVGGSLGTAVLGALVAAWVGVRLPGRLAQADVHLSGPMADAVRRVSVGGAPTGTPDAASLVVERIATMTYLEGMRAALAVTAGLTLVGAVIALWGRTSDRVTVSAAPQPDGHAAATD